MKYYTMFDYKGSGYNSARAASGVFWANYDIPPSKHPLPQYYIWSDVKDSMTVEISEDESFSGTMTMTVPINHPSYDNVVLGTIFEVCESKENPTLLEGQIKQNCGDCIWIGRLIRMSIDQWGNKTCTLEGPFTFLKDYIIQHNLFAVGNQSYTIAQVLNAFSDYKSTITSQLYDGFSMDDYERSGGIKLMVSINFGNLPSWMNSYYVSSNVFSNIFGTVDGRQFMYIGETASAYDVIKNILDTWYEKRPDISEAQANLSYALSYSISSVIDDDPLKPKGRDIYINIFEASDVQFNEPLQYKDTTLTLTNCIKSFNLTTSFDNLFTCVLIEGEEQPYPGPSGFKTRIVPSVGLPKVPNDEPSQTYNGMVNGYDEQLALHGLHSGFVNLKDLMGVEATDLPTVNNWVPYVMRRINAERYECDIVASDISEIDGWAEPIKIGYHYSIITPATKKLGIRYFRCTSRKINLSDSSKNEYKFSNYIRKDMFSALRITDVSKRVKQLEKENGDLRQVSSKLESLDTRLQKLSQRAGIKAEDIKEDE